METTKITQTYVRKPLEVEAVEVREDNFENVARWCFGEILNIDKTPVDMAKDANPRTQYIKVQVITPKNSRQTQAHLGDWILVSEQGYKVYTPKAFTAHFELKTEDAEEPERAGQHTNISDPGEDDE